MREILFRGKRTDNGEWVYGYYYETKYCRTDDELCDYITVPYIEQCNLPSSHYIVNPETVGQYTGLKDKNGTKIFEGDIIYAASKYDAADMVVVYNPAEFRLVLCEDYKTYKPGLRFKCYERFNMQVIGNIYDNKLEDF
jgi:uncharacterized phage protein (TIGR01671 family)